MFNLNRRFKMARAYFADLLLPTLYQWANEVKRRTVGNLYGPQGKYQLEHYRDGQLIGCYDFPNGITDAGLNHILGVQFNSTTQVTAWYTGLVDNSGWTAFAAGDTMSSHTGWNEFTNYSESTRQEWDAGSPSARSITNASPVTFTINGSGTLKGIFIVSNSTKSGTTGTLWSTAAFATTVPVASADVLKVTYTVSG
jgi:hypothetical protein